MTHENSTSWTNQSGARAVATAKTVPGVADAAAILRRRLRPIQSNMEAPATPQLVAGSSTPAFVRGAALQMPADYPATLIAALARAAQLGADRGTTYVLADGTTDRQLYPDLLADAEHVLGGLRAMGLRPGDPVLFQLLDNRRFVTTFWACVLGGFLPTPVGPAPSYVRDNAVVRKLHAAWQLLGRPLVMTERAVADELSALAGEWPGGPLRTAVFEEVAGAARDSVWYEPHPDEPAVNLLTSGSTGIPKCVQHPHRTLVARTYSTCLANDFTADDVALNWMPLDHVGGIIMFNMRDVFLACDHVNARTDAFVGRPLNWLDWTDRFRATNTWAPNFAFAMINDHADEIAAGSWDLSSLRNICNAGEAVVARTALRFLQLLAPHDLPGSAMRPCWGMSETSSGVTYSRMDRDHPNVSTETLDKRSIGGALRFTADRETDLVTLTNVGGPIPGVNLRIVDADNEILPECQVGRLQISGATILDRYFANPQANAESFTDDGWFNTGDLAFLREGTLTLTGREKDLIIVNGANYITSDLESVAEQVPGTEVTYVAACGVHDPDHGTDRVVVFFVPAASHPDHSGTASRIATALAADVGLSPDLVIPVTKDEFPKTASGKIQRAELISALQAGRFADRSVAGAMADAEPGPDATRVFTAVWTEAPALAQRATSTGDSLLVVGAGSAGEELAQHLTGLLPNLRVATVGPDHESDFARLLGGCGPVTVLHALAYGPAPQPATVGEFTAAITTGPVSVQRCVRAIAERDRAGDELIVLTSHAVWARPGDRVDPRRAALTGLVRTAAIEGAPIRMLDVSGSVPDGDNEGGRPPSPRPRTAAGHACRAMSEAAEVVTAELGMAMVGSGPDAVVAVRDGTRLVARLRTFEPAQQSTSDGIKPGGLYLLTGGLGGIGLELSAHLLAAYGARLLLIGRSPEAAVADRLTELRELGEVWYTPCDVADLAALAAAVAAAETAAGQPLNGVLHLAGASVAAYWDDPAAHAVDKESTAQLQEMLRPKLTGAWAIGQVLRDRPDALLVLFSSVNGLFGGRSFGAYAAANSALDGFADDWARAQGRRVHCIAWSIWSEVGMSRHAPSATVRLHGFRTLEVSEGLRCLVEAIGQPEPYLVVGLDSGNLSVLGMVDPSELGETELLLAIAPTDPDTDPTALANEVRKALGGNGRAVVVAEVPYTLDGQPDERRILELITSPSPAGARYVEPRTDMERTIAQIWCGVLNLRRVGREDNFFALGGNSVRVMKAMAQMNDLLGEAHPARVLYDNPTPGELADAVAG